MLFWRVCFFALGPICSIACSRSALALDYVIDGRPVSKQEYEAASLCNQAQQAIKDQKWQEAQAKLSDALVHSPGSKPLRNNLGIVLVRLGKYEESIKLLKELVAEDNTQAMAWATLGGAYMSVGKLDEAADAYKHFLRLKPDYPEAGRFKHVVHDIEKEAARRKKIGDSKFTDSYIKFIPAGAPKWKSLQQPLRVFIPKDSTARGYCPEYETTLRSSFKKWEAATGGFVRFEFVENKGDCNIDCEWRDDSDAQIFKAESGQVQFKTDRRTILHAKILMLTTGSADLPINAVMAGKLGLHEIGHALGIAGHSDDCDDIMSYSIDVSAGKGQISPRDVKTLSALYK